MLGSLGQRFRRGVSACLEHQAPAKRRVAWLAAPWERLAEPSRRLKLPRGYDVVGVAGATLGGSGATPVAIELCRELASRGARVGYVAHAYGSRVAGAARRVWPSAEAADEARLAARQLGCVGVPVFMADKRQAAIDAAARELPLGAVLVLDGALQATPQRFAESVLVVDGEVPWGSGFCPPVGDLRAQRVRLHTADTWLAMDRGGPIHPELVGRAQRARRRLTGVRNAQTAERRSLSWLAGRDFQLALAVARPERVHEQLLRHAVRARRLSTAADHAGLAALLTPKKSSNVECWVCTEKCWEATVGRDPAVARRVAGRVWLLEERVELPAQWLEALSARFVEPSRQVRASDRFDDSQRTGQGC
ncbi:MAG: tetraacyldisaccharide 4'-kinase [Polyangiaceae bacterium]|nr:tetraacyldisaccharide 4'-kinase [Polyangiaceae bacterium]